MRRRTPRSTRTYTLFHYPTLFRSAQVGLRDAAPFQAADDGGPGLHEALDARAKRQRARQPVRIGRVGSRIAAQVEHHAVGQRGLPGIAGAQVQRSEEHTSELQSIMRTSYAVFCLKKKN